MRSSSAESSIQSNDSFFLKHVSIPNSLAIHLLSTYYVPGTVQYTVDKVINDLFFTL